MFRYIIITFLSFFVIFNANNYSVFATESDETNIEASYLKGKKDEWLARGEVIVKKNNILLNAEEMNVYNEKQVDKTTGKPEKKMIIEAKDSIKIRQKDDTEIFASDMFLDERTDTGVIKNIQIYPSAPKDNSVLFANQFEKSKCIYTIKNSTYCPCLFFRDDFVLKNRETPFDKIGEYGDVLWEPKQKNPINNKPEEIHNDLQRNTFLSLYAEQMVYDNSEKLATLQNFTIRAFGIPFFYWHKYSFHTDQRGDSGLLMPTFLFNGLKQFGIEIPLYWKIRPDMDLTISRIQYIPLTQSYKDKMNVNIANGGNAYKLDDYYKIRQSMTGFRFRHLISQKYGYASFYNIDFLLADKSYLVDDATGLGKLDAYGNAVKGWRWMVDINARMKLTKTTYLILEQLYTSDKNFLYIQRRDTRQTQTNKFHLYDVNDNHYFSAELYTYRAMLLNLDYKTIPLAFPVIRGEYHFRKDKLGGNIYLKTQSYYLHRDQGYNHGTIHFDIGYRLPYTFKHGTKITFDTILRNQYDNVSNSALGGNALPLMTDLDNALNFYFGNYANFYQNPYYGIFNGKISRYRFLNFNKLQAEHPIILLSALGKTIINPKVAIRYSPNDGRNVYIPADDNFGMQMNYYNAFELLQSNGLGIYDTGGSAVYGADFTHKFKNKLEISGGIAQNYRFTGKLNENILSQQSGYKNSLSDIMGHFAITKDAFKLSGFFNYDTTNKQLRMFGGIIMYNYNQYILLHIGYYHYSKYATFIMQQIGLLTFSTTIKPTNKLSLVATIHYNTTELQTQSGYKKPALSYYSITGYYQISCFKLGIGISKNYMTLGNVPSTTTIKFKVAMTGIG